MDLDTHKVKLADPNPWLKVLVTTKKEYSYALKLCNLFIKGTSEDKEKL